MDRNIQNNINASRANHGRNVRNTIQITINTNRSNRERNTRNTEDIRDRLGAESSTRPRRNRVTDSGRRAGMMDRRQRAEEMAFYFTREELDALEPESPVRDAAWEEENRRDFLEHLARLQIEELGLNQPFGIPIPELERTHAQDLPTRHLSAADKSEDGSLSCDICMDDKQIGDEVTELPCAHWFDTECVMAWFENKDNKTCPKCKRRCII